MAKSDLQIEKIILSLATIHKHIIVGKELNQNVSNKAENTKNQKILLQNFKAFFAQYFFFFNTFRAFRFVLEMGKNGIAKKHVCFFASLFYFYFVWSKKKTPKISKNNLLRNKIEKKNELNFDLCSKLFFTIFFSKYSSFFFHWKY